jgi:hypothetical protein
VKGGDRGLQRIRSGSAAAQGALDPFAAFGNLRAIPTRAVLILEQYQIAGGVHARVTPRVVQQHQRDQRHRLGALG